MVYPATEKHIKKYQRQESFLVEETGKDYREITLPFIEENKFSLDVGVNFGIHIVIFILEFAALPVK